jgi:hypothetical protein
LSGGVRQVRVVLRALSLLQLANGASAPQIACVVPLTPQAITVEPGDLTEHRDLCGLPTIGDGLALAGDGVRVEGFNFENGSLRWLLF